MNAAGRAIAVAALLGAAACRDALAPGADEVAAELRAMRLALAARSEGSVGVEALRGQLAAQAAAQRATEARQAELQRDLAAWMQAVAADAGARRAAEAEQLRLRLDDLELALRQQRERQGEMEDALLQGIDRAAKQLDGMLDRLGPVGPASASSSAAPSTAPPSAPPTAPDTRPAAPADAPAVGDPPRGARPATSPPQAPPQAPGGPRRATAPGGAVAPAEAAARPTPAVGAEAPSPRSGALASNLPIAHGAWFVLAALGAVSACWWIRREVLAGRTERRVVAADGVPSDRIAVFEQLAAAATGAPASPPAPAPPAPRFAEELGAPERLFGAPADAARWLAALAGDPAVLREPPPQACAGDGGSEVRFWLRPGTSVAARARLRLRLLRPGG